MNRSAVLVGCVAAMIVVIVGLDVIIFRGHFWPRLMVNVGVVLVVGAFVLRFLPRS